MGGVYAIKVLAHAGVLCVWVESVKSRYGSLCVCSPLYGIAASCVLYIISNARQQSFHTVAVVLFVSYTGTLNLSKEQVVSYPPILLSLIHI